MREYTDDEWAELRIAFRLRKLYTVLDAMSRVLAMLETAKPVRAFVFDNTTPGFMLTVYNLMEIGECQSTIGIAN
jgi:hypothetical protein